MLTIEVADQGFRAYLQKLDEQLGDLTPVMQSIGMVMESRVSGRFETRTDPSGGSWAAWMPATLATYPEDGNRRLLDRYGDMLASLNHRADARSVTIGFGNPVAAYHEWGTEKMARRGMLFDDPNAGTLGAEDEAAVLDVLQQWLGGLG